MRDTQRRVSAYISLVVSSAMFAIGYIIAHLINPAAGMGMFVCQAMFCSALLFFIFKGNKPIGKLNFYLVAAIAYNGVSSPIIVYLILTGSRMVSPSLAAILVISNVLMIAAMARLLNRKKFTVIQLASLIAGFIGVTWISLEKGAFSGEGVGASYLLLAAFLIATITIAIEGPIKDRGWAPVTRWSFSISFIVTLVTIYISGNFAFHSPGQSALAIVLGFIALGAPVLLFNRGMGILGSADAAATKLLIPFFSLIYGVVFLNDIPGISSLSAGLIVVGSVGIYQYSASKVEK
ncbi:MAG TPA: DMT family transporter [Nitrospinota bacterium]|nr:DMT family transporter [Nitrospinota bacterium]|tara:strand:- start:173760 stop:174638 length:879 start_codon:yes stop_codon:yes gene_type:complete